MDKTLVGLKGRRGIVLITTLAIMTFMLMLAVMLVTTAHNSQRRAAFYYWSAAAAEAARAGAVFAQTALQANLGWMAMSQPGVVKTFTDGNVQVTQDFDRQTVQGFLFGQASNVTTEFRISFNPVSTFPNDGLSATVFSRNNLLQDAAAIYSNGLVSRAVPKRTAEIMVEGVTRASSTGAVLARRVVAVGLYRAPFMPAAASGGSIQVNVDPTAGQWKLQQAAGIASAPSVRSMGNVDLYANDASQFSSTIGSPFLPNSGQAFQLVDPGTGASKSSLSARFVNPSDNAQQIAQTAVTYDQVKSSSVRGTLPAGTYVYWSDQDTVPTYYQGLTYNPTDTSQRYVFDAGTKSIQVTNQYGIPLGPPLKPSGTASQPYSGFWGPGMKVSVANSVDVVAQSYTDPISGTATVNPTLAIMAAPTVTSRVSFQLASGQGVVLQNSNPGGSIALRGDVQGTGSVLALGDLVFEGHSALTPDPNSVVTMYSGGSTTLSPILNQVSAVDSTTVDTSNAGLTLTGQQVVWGYVQAAMQAWILNPNSRWQGMTAAEAGFTITTTGSNTTITSSGLTSGFISGLQDQMKGDLGSQVYKGVIVNAAPGGSTGFSDALRDSVVANSAQAYSNGGGLSWSFSARGSNWSFDSPASAPPPPTGGAAPTTQASSPAQDQEFRGLIYACKNFTTRIPPSANLSLQGAIVAYGGDPSRTFNVNDTTTWPGADGTGQMLFEGKNVTFTYDPTYLGGLYTLFPAGPLSRSFFASF